VTAVRSRRAVSTDQLGRFRLQIDHFPDTLIAAFIGRRPDSVALSGPPVEPLILRLAPSAVPLSALAVTARGRVDDVGQMGRWQWSLEQVRAPPPAIEADVFRALVQAPSVAFSSPLSARPLVRGYQAGESSLRLDGHEVVNPYHVGRMFSAFPADAAQQVSLTTAPARVSEGGALAGIVDVTGRAGTAPIEGGADVSLASATAWAGGGERASWFGAGRVVHFGLIGLITGQQIPYDFQDLYGSLVLGDARKPRGRVTMFGSRDHLQDGFSRMDWNDLLVGLRWQIADGATWGLSHSASIARFSETADDIRARGSLLDIRNRFARFTTGVDATLQGASFRLSLGASAGALAIANRLTPQAGGDIGERDVESRRAQASTYVEWSQQIGPATAQVGGRIDVAGAARAFQPRARIRMPLGTSVAASMAAGRTALLYQLVSDGRSEPNLAFYDFWLSAADSGVPVATADHLALDVDFMRCGLTARISTYASRASGLLELRPLSDPAPSSAGAFRVGRGRTLGAEVQVGVRGGTARPHSLSLSYILSRSQRNWGAGWVPWLEDRRHLVRLFGQAVLGKWSLSTTVEAGSGVPVTPIDQVILVNDLFEPARRGGVPSYIYGPENGLRGAGIARADLAIRYRFSGPWGSDATLGLSVLNLAFSPVAPVVPASPEINPGTVRVGYERLFDLPPIPTITLRISF
jgi:hypothetical protein